MANGNSFGVLFCVTTYGESHGGGGGGGGRLPAAAALERGRHPGGAGSAPPWPELHHHAAPGGGSLRDPLRGFPGLYAGHTHPHPGAQPGCPPPGLPRNGHHLSPFPCRRHLPGQVRHPQLAGGGRASARETIGRVAAGAIAKKILRLAAGVEILAYVQRVKDVEAQVDPSSVTAEQVEANIARCPDPEAAAAMIEKIEAAAREGDSLGEWWSAWPAMCPAGWAAPCLTN